MSLITNKVTALLRVTWWCFFAWLPHCSVAANTVKNLPTTDDVGIYLNNIPAVNLKEKKFQVDFNIWFRWKGDGVNPLENFEIVNGHIDSKDAPVKKKIGDINYGVHRVEATIFRNFALSKYPLDNHLLKIQIEDTSSDSNDLIFQPDKSNSGVSPKIDVAGWNITKFDSYASVTKYATNFGDISKASAQSLHPRYTFSVELKRAGHGNFIKVFSMLFMAAGLAFCAFRVRADYIDARIAFAASGVFLAVLTQNTLSTSLPESDSFGMADQLYNLTMVFIVLSFLACVQTFKIIISGDELRANKYSFWLGIWLPVVYVTAATVIVFVS